MSRKRTGGIVIGRFMPPHNGHRYLIDFAKSYCTGLTVFVCTLADEPIPGELRYAWMKHLFPDVSIVHITEEIPEAARSRSGAQEIWAQSIRRHVDTDPRYVFASEEYGVELARALGARFVPVDPRRELFSVSAGMIRSNPIGYWEYLPELVRPYFVCRISVAGAPASSSPTGTPAVAPTNVAAELAARFETVHAADYGAYRRDLGFPDPAISTADELITAQVASQNALLSRANRVLFLGTDLLRTVLEADDADVQARFSAGAYDDMLEATRPHAVIALSAPNRIYREEAGRRGWTVHDVPEDHPDPMAAAEEIARTVLSGHWKSAP